mmetsp:Transcript_11164/g.35618  ORF Transcript_11164/g.35618 Transcript_11164/m.35618 type:complete len:288 (+) Transcript_11164:1187-2050(+)
MHGKARPAQAANQAQARLDHQTLAHVALLGRAGSTAADVARRRRPRRWAVREEHLVAPVGPFYARVGDAVGCPGAQLRDAAVGGGLRAEAERREGEEARRARVRHHQPAGDVEDPCVKGLLGPRGQEGMVRGAVLHASCRAHGGRVGPFRGDLIGRRVDEPGPTQDRQTRVQHGDRRALEPVGLRQGLLAPVRRRRRRALVEAVDAQREDKGAAWAQAARRRGERRVVRLERLRPVENRLILCLRSRAPEIGWRAKIGKVGQHQRKYRGVERPHVGPYAEQKAFGTR